MSQQKKEKKRFWDGSFWQTIKEKVPAVAGDLLQVSGELTGIELLERAGDMITRVDDLTPEEKVELLEMKQLELEEFRIEVEDRSSARTREAELAKAGQRDWFMYLVGAVGLAAFLFMIYALAYRDIPEGNREIFIHAVGIIEGVVITIFAYYFGSSKGSKDKTNLLTKATT